MLSSRPIHPNNDASFFPTKTPGRGQRNRTENVHAGLGSAMTVHGKGKSANMPPKTPFQPKSAQPNKLLKDSKIVLATIGRPLGDKTPLPNRVNNILFKTPLPGNSKLSKLQDFEIDDEGVTPESVQRPSSMRTHLKHPRNSFGKPLQTPANIGGHWEVNDGDFQIGDAQSVISEDIMNGEDDSDELEYCPPNTLDLPYDPPFAFELPNYTEVGKAMFKLAHTVPIDDMVPPAEVEIQLSDLDAPSWDFGPLPELESDDPFVVARAELAANATKSTSNTASKKAGVSNVPAVSLKPPRSTVANANIRPASGRITSAAPGTIKRPASVAAITRKPTTIIEFKPQPAVSRSKSRTATTSIPSVASRRIDSTAKTSSNTVNGSTTRVARPLATPSLAKFRVDPLQRRPHTSLAVSQKKTSYLVSKASKQTSTKPVVLNVADILIKHIGDELDDQLDFKFDV